MDEFLKDSMTPEQWKYYDMGYKASEESRRLTLSDVLGMITLGSSIVIPAAATAWLMDKFSYEIKHFVISIFEYLPIN